MKKLYIKHSTGMWLRSIISQQNKHKTLLLLIEDVLNMVLIKQFHCQCVWQKEKAFLSIKVCLIFFGVCDFNFLRFKGELWIFNFLKITFVIPAFNRQIFLLKTLNIWCIRSSQGEGKRKGKRDSISTMLHVFKTFF